MLRKLNFPTLYILFLGKHWATAVHSPIWRSSNHQQALNSRKWLFWRVGNPCEHGYTDSDGKKWLCTTCDSALSHCNNVMPVQVLLPCRICKFCDCIFLDLRWLLTEAMSYLVFCALTKSQFWVFYQYLSIATFLTHATPNILHCLTLALCVSIRSRFSHLKITCIIHSTEGRGTWYQLARLHP